MSYKKLLSEDKKSFVRKVYSEMYNNAMANTHNRESKKIYFLQLVERNEELSEIEKQWCREKIIYGFELHNAKNKSGKPRGCDNCKAIRYSDRFCEWCISLRLQSLFNTWTSENEIIDDFIRKCQIQSSLPHRTLEWIPFEEFKNIEKSFVSIS